MSVNDVLQQQLLPFYLVCDESWSMDGEGIDAINDALPDLHAEISTNPAVADKTRFSMLGFSDDAEVLLELVDLSDIDGMPAVEAQGGTSFGSAFRLLHQQIKSDIAMLKNDGHKVFRPVVFFMTDGNPTDRDEWEAEFETLIKSPSHPKIVAFGVGNGIEEDTIRRIGTFKAFVSDGTLSPAQALKEFASALTRSIIASGSSADQDGNIQVQVPKQIEGFTALDLDEV